MSYKLLSYQAGRQARAGVLVGDTVYDAAGVTRTPAYASVLGVLQDWSRAQRALARATKALATGKTRARGVPLARARLLAPVLYPEAVFCASGSTSVIAERMKPGATQLTVMLRLASSCASAFDMPTSPALDAA